MKLTNKQLSSLPPLAWLAVCSNENSEIVAYHGERVEIGERFCVSAVWDGEFDGANFDQTDIVAGTGIRIHSLQFAPSYFFVCGFISN